MNDAARGRDGHGHGDTDRSPGRVARAYGRLAMDEFLNKKEGYEITEADQQMMVAGQGSLSVSS